MPDPLTVISSLSAIITVKEATTKTVTTLIDLRHTWKDSDLIFLAFSSQLTALRAALDQIQEWMERGDGRAHHQLIMDLDVSLSCCKLLVSRIDDFIFQLDRSTDTPLDVAGKAKVVLGVRGLDEAQKLLERQIQALTLLLTACNCQTLAEQKQLLERPKSRKTLERVEASSISLYVHRDTTSITSTWTDNLSRMSVIFDFDRVILATKVYERVFRGFIDASLRVGQSLRQERKTIHFILLGDDDDGRSKVHNLLQKSSSTATNQAQDTEQTVAGGKIINFNVGDSQLAMLEIAHGEDIEKQSAVITKGSPFILYVVDMSAYDEPAPFLHTNRLANSMTSLANILRLQKFTESKVLVCLNKQKEFRRKLYKIPLYFYFPHLPISYHFGMPAVAAVEQLFTKATPHADQIYTRSWNCSFTLEHILKKAYPDGLK